MSFVINSNLIGSEKHYSSDGNWVDDLPKDGWIIGESSTKQDLLTALMLVGKKIEIEPPKEYLKVIRKFTYSDCIPWKMAMPEYAFEKWLSSIVDKVSKALKVSNLSYHTNVFTPFCEVLESLEPMRVHRKKWKYLSSHDIPGVNQDVIGSFKPNEDGYADLIQYELNSTVSGRLKVDSGPEILRLNKELKSIIKSRYKGGKVVQFDYVSLEPRLALILTGHEISEDIYSDISSMVFKQQFSRDIVKISTLSVMYGSGAGSLSEKTNLPMSICKGIIKQLKEFFDIHSISKKLNKEFREKKIIYNHFGRAIYPETDAGHKLYNNFIQSTAVDAAMIGFRNIIKLWENTKIVPLFVIHDNLGLDFPPEMLTEENIAKTKQAGSIIPNLGGKLLLGHDIV